MSPPCSGSKSKFLPASCYFLASLNFQLRRWWRNVPPKCRFTLNEIHCVVFSEDRRLQRKVSALNHIFLLSIQRIHLFLVCYPKVGHHVHKACYGFHPEPVVLNPPYYIVLSVRPILILSYYRMGWRSCKALDSPTILTEGFRNFLSPSRQMPR
jgi:hypothetical protein